MVEFPPLTIHHSIVQVLFKHFPETITHKQDHLGCESKCKEHNDHPTRSGMNLTVTKMTKSFYPRLICIINFFCGKFVLWLVAGVSPETFFLFTQLQPSVFCHLSLKEMSHGDWKNLLESVGSSLSSSCLQSLFSSVSVGSQWTLLSVVAQAGLSALAYLRREDLRPHTDWRKEGTLELSLLLTSYSTERALFPAIIKHKLHNRNMFNPYIVTCQHFF